MSVWSFVLTLVRSLLAFFSSFCRRRAPGDPFSSPNAARLRPILLTPRSIALSRTRTLSPAHADDPTSEPQRTSPKLDQHDAELGLPIEHPAQPAARATSLREHTPETSATGSLYVSPLTPPDRCYLAPLPSTTDCPYTEPWPTGVALDRNKSRPPGSPLRASMNINRTFPEPMVAPIGSPPPGRWSPVQIWTSTPYKNDSAVVPDLVLGSFDHDKDTAVLEINLSQAIITRSQSSIQPYDNASNSSASSSDVPPFVELAVTRPAPIHERHRALAHVSRSKHQPYPRFHHPDAYAYTWRRHGARLPGRANRSHGHSRSHSDVDIPSEWFDADAYAPSPIAALSPPLGDSATEDEDEDEMPLYRVRERLANRNIVGTTLGLNVSLKGGGGDDTRRAAILSPRTRRMSEGCLLALSETTPTRVGMSTRSSRQVLSMVLDGDEYDTQDWLEALSLRFSSESKDACMAAPSVDAMVV